MPWASSWPSVSLTRPSPRTPSRQLDAGDEECPLAMRSAVAFRELGNDPARPRACGDALDVVEAVSEARRPFLPRRPRRVRRQRDVGQGEEWMVRLGRLLHEYIEPGARDLLPGQGAQERVLVHHGTAAGVDEDGLRLH